MISYALEIKDHNVQAHLDIEEDIALKKNGLFTFTIRVNNGNIVDYNVTEYVDVKQKYGIIKGLLIEEFTVALDSGERGTTDPIRDDHL